MAPTTMPRSSTGALQSKLRLHWELQFAATHFQRLSNKSLLPYIGQIVQIFTLPVSPGILFQFAEGMREPFARLLSNRAFPPATLNEAIRTVVPDTRPISTTPSPHLRVPLRSSSLACQKSAQPSRAPVLATLRILP